jgi:hypothetical protein
MLKREKVSNIKKTKVERFFMNFFSFLERMKKKSEIKIVKTHSSNEEE